MAVIKQKDFNPINEDNKRGPRSSEHDRLCEIAYSWLLKAKGCSFAFKELTTYASEIPDAIGWKGSGGQTFLVECKANRADFLSDRKKIFRRDPSRGMGLFRFYCCPTGLIKREELPEKWGLIYVNDKNRARQVVGGKGNIFSSHKEFMFHERNKRGEAIMLTSALRRLHLRGVLSMIYEAQT